MPETKQDTDFADLAREITHAEIQRILPLAIEGVKNEIGQMLNQYTQSLEARMQQAIESAANEIARRAQSELEARVQTTSNPMVHPVLQLLLSQLKPSSQSDNWLEQIARMQQAMQAMTQPVINGYMQAFVQGMKTASDVFGMALKGGRTPDEVASAAENIVQKLTQMGQAGQ